MISPTQQKYIWYKHQEETLTSVECYLSDVSDGVWVVWNEAGYVNNIILASSLRRRKSGLIRCWYRYKVIDRPRVFRWCCRDKLKEKKNYAANITPSVNSRACT